MRTVGVLTGFDDYEALETENPDAIVNDIQNLLEVIEAYCLGPEIICYNFPYLKQR